MCSCLTGSIVLPHGLTIIKSSVFKDCYGFNESIVLPTSVISIISDAFNNCSGITRPLIIPSSITSIGSKAFYKCSSLAGIKILSSFILIESYAFQYCGGLPGSLKISSNYIHIQKYAFSQTYFNKVEITSHNIIANCSKKSFDSRTKTVDVPYDYIGSEFCEININRKAQAAKTKTIRFNKNPLFSILRN